MIMMCRARSQIRQDDINTHAAFFGRCLVAAMMMFSMTNIGYAAPDDCKSSPNEGALLACRKKNYKEENAELARLIKLLHDRFVDDGHERESALTKAQAAWKTYRENECAMRSFESKGTGYESYLLDCLYKITHLRVVDLKEIANNP